MLANNFTEKIQRDLDNLTPLDARNSLLMDPVGHRDLKAPHVTGYPMSTYGNRSSYDSSQPYRDQTPPPRGWREARESSENLVSSAASIGHRHHRSSSRDSEGASPMPMARRPTVPIMDSPRGRAY